MTGFKARMQLVIPAYAIILCMTFVFCGCEAFARKFTRKQKKQDKPQVEMVLAPQAYPDSQANKEDAYRQYFTFWSSWHDELIDNLADPSPSMRRQLDNIQEAINNLSEMQRLLSGDKQAEAGGYLVSLNALKTQIAQDIYGNNMWSTHKQAENLKRQINRALQYQQVKDFLK